MYRRMERVEKFEKMIENTDTFIQEATSFLYEHIEDPVTSEIIECTRAIILTNLRYLSKKEEAIEKLRKTLATSAPITASLTKSIASRSSRKTEQKPQHTSKNIQELIELIKYSNLKQETMHVLKAQSHEDIVRIKLHFYKLIIDTKKSIKETCLSDPLADIKELQSNLENYSLILDAIFELEKNDSSEKLIESEKEYSNIVFAPNGKRSTYIYEDISEYPEKTKEIKLIIDKLIDGYFLRTKDTRRIESYQENLYEYKHPNGIRILYVVEGSITIICSLFMKDKQKSSRITNEFDESINRYYSIRDYITTNFAVPDFHIEQAELIGEIYNFFDGVNLSKKVGDE